MTYTVVSASHADMENLPDYDLCNEGIFTTREAAEAQAEALNADQGHTYSFWVLTHKELLAL